MVTEAQWREEIYAKIDVLAKERDALLILAKERDALLILVEEQAKLISKLLEMMKRVEALGANK